MDYDKKYLKYKSKFLSLKKDLTARGYNVDELMRDAENNITMNNQQLSETI